MPIQHNASSNRIEDKTVSLIAKSILTSLIPLFAVFIMLLSAKASQAGDNIWTWTGLGGWVLQIVADPLDPNTVYASTYEGVMKSTDGGKTWENITKSIDGDVNWLQMAAGSPNLLYVAASSGTYQSANGGANWRLVHAKCCVYAVSPADWREAYLVEVVSEDIGVTTSKLHKTIDGGQNWTEMTGWLPEFGRIQDIAIAPSAPHILIATTERPLNGIMYKSVNGGESWSPIGGNYIEEIFSVSFDPKNSNTIYLATKSPAGWKSTDGGNTWQPLSNGLQSWNWGFSINAANTQVLHAANSSAGVRESLDGGLSWAPLNYGIDGLSVRSIAIAAYDPLEIYAGMENGAGVWKLTRTTIQDFGITTNDGALFTNQTGVTLTLTAPPGTTQMIISNEGGFNDASWESFATTKPWTITSYGEYVIPRTVYAKFRTNGQISAQYQDDIILDQTPPVGEIEISDMPSDLIPSQLLDTHASADTLDHVAYLPFVSKNYFPGRRSVTLLLSATDDVSGVDSMILSNDGAFADARWQPYATRLDWWVLDKGLTTIYVKYRDRAGNESQVYSVTTSLPE